jgi:flagellar biosynthesis protein FlhA
VRKDLVVAAAVLTIVLVVFLPLPAAVVDLLLVGSLALSVLVLLATVTVREPARFTVFPTVLLLATAFRLAMNIATTRMILGRAHLDGPLAAGRVVRAFGDFVAANQLAVGAVVFAVLVIVNFAVISSGATRISEVAARFTLDALPGKQLAIDADVAAGSIDPAGAMRRREAVAREADFYGAMDGASKFIRGDAVAGVFITAVNIVGGILVGVIQHGMPGAQALRTFTLLTIGDGLVSGLPGLIVSLAAGVLVTRASTASSLGAQVMDQLLSEKRALRLTAGFLALLAGTAVFLGSGLPWIQLLVVGGILLAFSVFRRDEAEAAPAPAKPAETLDSLLRVEPIELEVGVALIPNVSCGLVERVAQLRREIAAELGVVVPSIRIRDSFEVGPRDYVVRLRGAVVARGQGALRILPHLAETVRRHAADLLTRDDVVELLKVLRQTRPAVVAEVVPGLVKPGELQKVLQSLLREGASIRDLGTILETLGDLAPLRDLDEAAERARVAVGRGLCARYAGRDGRLRAVLAEPGVDVERLRRELDRLVLEGHPPVVVCERDRRAVRRLAAQARGDAVVLAMAEVPGDLPLEVAGSAAVAEEAR